MAPVAVTWVRGIGRRSSGGARAIRTAEFVCGYLLVWTAVGAPVYVVLAGTGRLSADHPAAGRWIGFAVFLIAGLYQLGPLKPDSSSSPRGRSTRHSPTSGGSEIR
ncbi:DUF2182 domain-containing protein [Streptomyces sp. NPDC050743]|uniref:copper chaperone n=1 Tax=Streptomyces sp. NPDC050743 TaxID=3365634 RepID=UPI0037B118C4